ncbi:MAG: SPOR domain-containing protein, partial [Betaproteobacteria bacterium HGW-Betaproteobacteria-17]
PDPVVPDPVAQPAPADEPEAAAAPVLPSPPQAEPAKPVPQAASAPRPAPRPEPVKAASVKPVSAPPKPAATPAPEAKPAAASEAFVVQLAALSDSAKAQALKARAAEAGLPAYTDKLGALTRVRVGPYPSREAAVAAAVKLAENGMTGQILTR